MVLSKEYLILELAYLEKELEKLPKVKYGKHIIRGIEHSTIRYKTDDNKWRDKLLSNTSDDERNTVARRMSINSKYNTLKGMWSRNYKGDFHPYINQYKINKKNFLLPGNFFNTCQSQALSTDTESELFHNGYKMRSRTEIAIAKDLDALGLIYKYEVLVPGTNKYADFLIYLPSLDCCFFLEYLGQMKDADYLNRLTGKLYTYSNSNYRINYEVALLYGDKNNIPSSSEVEYVINHVILNLIKERLQRIN